MFRAAMSRCSGARSTMCISFEHMSYGCAPRGVFSRTDTIQKQIMIPIIRIMITMLLTITKILLNSQRRHCTGSGNFMDSHSPDGSIGSPTEPPGLFDHGQSRAGTAPLPSAPSESV